MELTWLRHPAMHADRGGGSFWLLPLSHQPGCCRSAQSELARRGRLPAICLCLCLYPINGNERVLSPGNKLESSRQVSFNQRSQMSLAGEQAELGRTCEAWESMVKVFGIANFSGAPAPYKNLNMKFHGIRGNSFPAENCLCACVCTPAWCGRQCGRQAGDSLTGHRRTSSPGCSGFSGTGGCPAAAWRSSSAGS